MADKLSERLAQHPTVRKMQSRKAQKPGVLDDLVLKPLQEKKETLYVLPNSRAKAHAERRYPRKAVKVVDGGVRGR
jgi:hypothetical protein